MQRPQLWSKTDLIVCRCCFIQNPFFIWGAAFGLKMLILVSQDFISDLRIFTSSHSSLCLMFKPILFFFWVYINVEIRIASVMSSTYELLQGFTGDS